MIGRPEKACNQWTQRAAGVPTRVRAPARRAVDAAFAHALRDGRVVLGYALTFGAGGRGSNGCVLHPIGLAIVQRSDERTEAPLFRAPGNGTQFDPAVVDAFLQVASAFRLTTKITRLSDSASSMRGSDQLFG